MTTGMHKYLSKMAKDTYANFDELKRSEKIDKDFTIFLRDVGAQISIIAPHGGKIEPHTSDIAKAIACEQFNCYCFEGIKTKHNGRLHITSHRFDEPIVLTLLQKSRKIVVVHACKGTEGTVYIGGLDELLKKAIATELENKGIRTVKDHPKFLGSNPDNLCNRGSSRKGVQLEITRDLRDDREKVGLIAAAVRNALQKVPLAEARTANH